jgi:hypothetical protein
MSKHTNKDLEIEKVIYALFTKVLKKDIFFNHSLFSIPVKR